MTEDKNIYEREDDFEVSFIFTYDELYTLILLSGELTESGKIFTEKAIAGAVENDLSNLTNKKMAHMRDGKMSVEPIIRMLGAAICKADSLEIIDPADKDGNVAYIISSPWIKIKCENYSKAANHIKLTPLKQ